jgi:hypothetical protein
MNRRSSAALLLVAAGLLAGAAAARAGDPMTSETQAIPQSAVDAGGDNQGASAGNALDAAAAEDLQRSTMTSASYILGLGGMEVYSRPNPVTDLAGIQATASSATLTWSAPGWDGDQGALGPGSTYYVRVASYTVPDTFSPQYAAKLGLASAVPGTLISTGTPAALIPNTTWFSQAWVLDRGRNLSFASNRSTFTSLTVAPRTLVTTFQAVYPASVTVSWAALPRSPPDASSKTAEGYVLEASSTNFGALAPGGVIYSSATTNVLCSTLTIVDQPFPLSSANTYYFRVGALNWVGVSSYTFLGSTVTPLALFAPDADDPPFPSASSYSLTALWIRNGNPPSSVFNIQASTASDFTGFLYSSTTRNLTYEMMTLSANTTYFFRVNATSKSITGDWFVFPGTATLTPPPAAAASSFSGLADTQLTVSWLPGANPQTVSTYTVVLTTESSFPNADAGNIAVSTTPKGALPTATLTGLSPNATYFAFVAGLNWQGAPSLYASLGSTVTYAAQPAASPPSLREVDYSSMTVAWSAGLNPVGVTTYTVTLTTGAAFPNSFSGNVVVSTAPDGSPVTAAIPGLLLNTTYHAFVAGVDWAGRTGAALSLGSTATLAAAPSASPDASTFTAVAQTALTVNWSSGSAVPGYNAAGTTYYALLSADPGFSLAASTRVFALSADFTGLSVNTTYYARVAAYSVQSGTWTAYDDLGAVSTLANAPAAAAAPFPAVGSSSMTVAWLPNGNPLSVTTYTVVLSPRDTYPNADPGNVSVSTAPAGAAPAASFAGLPSNTTYYLFAAGVNAQGVESAYAALGSTATMADAPGGAAQAATYISSVVVSFSPMSAAGFQLRASSTNFGALSPGGLVYFSSTTDGGASSLPLVGLSANTTYYAFPGAYNWRGAVTQADPVALVTVPPPVTSPLIFKVFDTSVTLTWTALPAGPPQSATGEGYRVDAATADALGNADFGGDLVSSVTYNRASASLIVTGLDPGTTYAFRIGSLNWEGDANFVLAGSTFTHVTPMTWVGGGGNTNWYNAGNWSPRGVPGPGSPVTIPLAVSVTVSASSPAITFSSITLGVPAGTVKSNITLSTGALGGDLLIYGSAGLTLATTQAFVLTGDMTMVSGSSMTSTKILTTPATSWIDLRVGGTFDLRAGALITTVGQGYAGGPIRTAGFGPGAGGGANSNGNGGGGGGHGGAGGAGSLGAAGAANDTAANPTSPGSGGGGGRSTVNTGGAGGAGGGLVRIQASSMSVNGSILADGVGGGAGTGAGGGGSGGGIQLTADFFSGTGVVQSTGGAGGGTNAGGGGGGIISIAINTSGATCDLFFAVGGGTSGINQGGTGVISTTQTLASPALSAVYSGTYAVHWNFTNVPAGKTYQIFSSTGGLGQSPVLSPGTTQYTETGLLPNTTYTRFVQAGACGTASNSPSVAFATLPSTITALSDPIVALGRLFITAGWAALPSSPQAASSEGYELDVSSRADFQDGTVLSSTTYNAAASTLSVTGLLANTTYFMRVAALNPAGTPGAFVALGSTSTLTQTVTALANTYLSVFDDSATLAWAALPGAGPGPDYSPTAEGYILEASTTDFGAASPGGVVVSSLTWSRLSTTATVSGLELDATWYFRVGSLNWSGAPNYADLAPLNMEVFPSSTGISLGSLDPGVFASTISVSSIVVVNRGSLPLSFALYAATATAGGSLWSVATSSGEEQVVLEALWNSSAPGDSSFPDGGANAVLSSTRTSTVTLFAGDQNGAAVPPGQSRTLWFRFWRPSSTVSAGKESLRVLLRGKYP